MLGKAYKIKHSSKLVKVLKQYETIVLCLDVNEPTRIFWNKKRERKYIVKISSLEDVENIKQQQGSLF
jgi:hypothetical protein